MNKFKAFDGKDIHYRRWNTQKEKLAVIQIVHGMAEHSNCYSELAEFFSNHGFVVYCHDQRGHGRTAGTREDYGFLAESEGWLALQKDLKQFNSIIKSEQPDLPVFIYGHSMGSVVVQDYFRDHSSELAGIILSGVPTPGNLSILAMRLIARHEIKKYGLRYRSKLLSKLSFGNYNKKFKPVKTACDWLSRDQEKVQNYIDDPFCGGTFTAEFFWEFSKGIKRVNDSSRLKNVQHNLSFLFMTGEADAVNDFSSAVWDKIEYYERHGFYDIEAVFYPQSRHDLKLELNREVFFADMLTWLKSKINH